MTNMMTLADAVAMVPGSALVGDGARAFERVHTDTRTLRAGDLFVALKGERFDAHDFLPQARAAGAFDGNPVVKIVDRREAIAKVLADAGANDVVLVAGKGHEDYQEINGVRHPFSDVEEALIGLKKRGLVA